MPPGIKDDRTLVRQTLVIRLLEIRVGNRDRAQSRIFVFIGDRHHLTDVQLRRILLWLDGDRDAALYNLGGSGRRHIDVTQIIDFDGQDLGVRNQRIARVVVLVAAIEQTIQGAVHVGQSSGEGHVGCQHAGARGCFVINFNGVGRALEDLPAGRTMAVRSSAPGEDSTSISFAGLHESVIGVQGLDAVREAVRKVWASLWSDAALLYRRELQLDPLKSRMAGDDSALDQYLQDVSQHELITPDEENTAN